MTLLDEITKLSEPAAELPDLEDQTEDGTSANIKASKTVQQRRLNDFDDEKYSGAKVSRSSIFGDNEEMSGLARKQSFSEEEDSDEDEEMLDEEEEGTGTGSEGDDIDDEEENEESDAEEDDDEQDEVDQVSAKIKTLTDSSSEENKAGKKAALITQQRRTWDELMYTNIKLHGLLSTCNVLPRGEAVVKMHNECDKETKANLEKATSNFEKLRSLMCEAFDIIGKGREKEKEDDEEITSDESGDEDDDDDEQEDEDMDEGEEDDENEDQSNDQEKSNGKKSAKDLADILQKDDDQFEKFRSDTIKKWHNRTKLMSAKQSNNSDFSAFDKAGINSQISKVLSDKTRLLRKVHTNRSGKKRIGATEADVDEEIFDDGDFYQTLLRQMIDNKSDEANTGADMTRSYIELQKLTNNNSKKRDVSSLSSKERKLKFEPIPKLINFHPAKPETLTWTHESRNELFKSLFS